MREIYLVFKISVRYNILYSHNRITLLSSFVNNNLREFCNFYEIRDGASGFFTFRGK